jgi:putative oxidoreductase
MKIAATIARYLLGLIFFVFGLNKFLNFIPAGPMPAGVLGEFTGVMIATKYFMLVGTFEVVGGLLLIFNRFVPLALALLAPVIVNILFVNIAMAPQGLPAGGVAAICWALVYLRHRSAFTGIWQKRMEE